MEFVEFSRQLSRHVKTLTDVATRLYIVDVDKDALWNTYLDAFAPEHNKVYRARREHDCSGCRHFVKEFGGVVAIIDGVVKTIWDFAAKDQYAPVVAALAQYVRSRPIRDVYLAERPGVGVVQNIEDMNGVMHTWHHLNVTLPTQFVHRGSANMATVLGDFRTARAVFKRALEELTPDSIQTTLELIAQGSLYRGDEWRDALVVFADIQRAYLALTPAKRELYTWSAPVPTGVSRIRNSAVGTLLIDLSEGTDLEVAVRKYEAVVAPANYKRPKATFTKKMLEEAQQTVEALGLTASLGRRFADLDDITAADTLFIDRDAKRRVDGGVFSEMAEQATVSPKNFSKVEEVPVERFLKDVLPGAAKVEVLFERRHASNLVSLLAPTDREAPPLFKWDNGFSWAYTGNVTDSMKEQVKAAGGAVDGVLRFSIRWNEDGKSRVDLDAHSRGPDKHIYYCNKCQQDPRNGFLDVDMISPAGTGVENISWPANAKLCPGAYRFAVNNFSGHRNHDGFDAEIEFNGVIYAFSYRQAFVGEIAVAEVVVARDGTMTLKDLLKGTEHAAKGSQLWGCTTGQFQRVQFVSYSPNHWEGTPKTGNKHLLFMLSGCVSDESPNGFYNEFLRPELNKHRKVFEAMGAKMRVAPSSDQLSGLGFSSTKRDHLICRVTGKTARVIKIAL